MTGEPSDGRTSKDEWSWKEGNTGGNHISCLWPHLKRFSVFPVSFFYLFVFQWILCSSAASLASSLSSRSSMSSRSTFEKLLRHWWPWQPWRPDDLSDLDDLDGFREFQYGIFFCLAKWMSSHSSSKKLTEIWRIQDKDFRPKRSLIWKRRKWNCISVKSGRSF